jgi:AraC-like DNA-binding protein
MEAEGVLCVSGEQVRASRCARLVNKLGSSRYERWRVRRGLGQAIRRLRQADDLTIEDLAHAAGMHPTYLSGIERGVRNSN